MNNVKASLPNILTFANLSLGIIAILLSVMDNSNDTLIKASLLIIIAALTDRFDGKIARMLGVTSELGKELDSLSDLISFGVAPIIICWKINFMPLDMSIIGYVLALIFPIAGAYRLARYNVTTFDNVFRGVPITVAGAFLTIDNIYNCTAKNYNTYTSTNLWVVIGMVILLSILMVSRFQIKKR